MRITRDTMDELNSVLMDLTDDTGPALRDALDTWLDEENERDERADAREILDTEIDVLAGLCQDLLRIIDPKSLS
jgi:hypothetical protein